MHTRDTVSGQAAIYRPVVSSTKDDPDAGDAFLGWAAL